MSPQMDSLQRLQSWYQAYCNGEWEHEYGVVIQTLDNPGWIVKIDLTGTPLQNLTMEPLDIGQVNHLELDGAQDWLHCKVENNCFEGAGGPFSLSRICDVFRNWVEGKRG
jgi:Immunity protein 53